MNKDYVIGKPFTPSEIVNFKTVSAYQITLSWGGGLGGSTMNIYTKNKVEPQDVIEVVDFYGVKHIINFRYVVKITPIKIVIQDIKNCGNEYMGTLGEVKRYLYAIHQSDTARSTEGYWKDDIKDLKIGEPYIIKNSN